MSRGFLVMHILSVSMIFLAILYSNFFERLTFSKNHQKMAKNIFETLKICITRNPLFNNILKPFKYNLNHTKNGQKRKNIAKMHQKLQKKLAKPRPKTAFKHLRYAPIVTPWSKLHWGPSQNPGQLCLLHSQCPIKHFIGEISLNG